MAKHNGVARCSGAIAPAFDWSRALCSTAAGALLTVAVIATPAAYATHTEGVFELDGNAADNPAGPPDDWQNITAPGPGQTGIVPDLGGNSVFTTGGSKDIYDVSKWKATSKSSPPKDEITNAYAKAYSNTAGDLIIVAGADRYSTSGTADIGFWFFQQDVGPLPNGSFGPGGHVVGDVLIVAEYTNGGRVGAINVFEWTASGLVQVVSANDADCTSAAHAADPEGPCGRTNSATIPVFWSYAGKNGNQPEAGAFVEVGVNISEIGRRSHVQTGCFSSFLAESRSSVTANSVLKDFVHGNFDVCGISAAKVCVNDATAPKVNTDGSSIHSKFTETITNSGIGLVYDVSVTEKTVLSATKSCKITGVSPSDAGTPALPVTLATNTAVQVRNTLSAAAGSNTVAVTVECDSTANGFSNTITATAGSTDGRSDLTADATTPTICSATTQARLTLTKTCHPVGGGVTFVPNTLQPLVCVDISVTNGGNEALDGVVVNDTPLLGNGIGGVSTHVFSGSLAPGEVKTFTANPATESGCYRPTAQDDPTNTVPHLAQFTDTVNASGTGRLSGTLINADPKPATCELCPD